MKTLLVTTDLSSESTKAFPVAVEIARSFGSKVILIAVVEDPTQVAFAYAMDFPVYPDPTVHQQVIKKVAGDLQELLVKHFAEVQSEAMVVEAAGSVAGEITASAQALHADMIIMASHGRSGLSRLLIGSVAERVIREAGCPVLSVPVRFEALRPVKEP